MKDTIYVKLDSWHAIDLRDAVELDAKTLETGKTTRCGREIPAGSSTDPDLPLGEKSCEVCLRLLAHDRDAVDQPAANPDADDGTVEADDPEV